MVGLTVLFVPVRAWGQTTLHAVGEAAAGYNDNISGAADHPTAGSPARIGDGFMQVEAGLLTITEARRAVYMFDVAHRTTMFLTHTQASAASDRVGWRGLFELTGRDDLFLSADLGRTSQNLATLQQSASTTPLAAQATGRTIFLTAAVSENWTRLLSPDWTTRQLSSSLWYVPINASPRQPQRLDFDNSFGADRHWIRDTLGADVRAGYFESTAVGSLPAQRQLITGLQGRWQRELARSWTSELQFGATAAMRSVAPGGQIWAPTGRAAVRYRTEDGEAEGYYGRTMRPNLFIGQNFLTDEVALRGSIPLGRSTGLRASGSVGYLHNRLIDLANSVLSTSTDVFVADAALGWSPIAALTLEARYQRFQQSQASGSANSVPGFSRDVAMISLRGMFPQREAPRLRADSRERLGTYDRTTEPLRGRGSQRDQHNRPEDTSTGAPEQGPGETSQHDR
jgi:hypothetical protein